MDPARLIEYRRHHRQPRVPKLLRRRILGLIGLGHRHRGASWRVSGIGTKQPGHTFSPALTHLGVSCSSDIDYHRTAVDEEQAMRSVFTAASILISTSAMVAAHPAPAEGPYIARCMLKLPLVNKDRSLTHKAPYTMAEWRRECDIDYRAAVSMSTPIVTNVDRSCFPLSLTVEQCRQLKAR